MKRSTVIFLLVMLFSSELLWAKYPTPITGSFLPSVERAAVGKSVPLTLTLETVKPFKFVEVTIKLPKGLELTNGEKVREIADFQPGEKKIFHYTVRVKDKGEQKITVSARVKNLGEGEAWGNFFISVINPELVKSNTKIMTDSDGIKVIVNE